jgi:GTP-binding protein HflX
MVESGDSGRSRVVLVAVQLPGVDDRALSASLAELGRLVETLGLVVVDTLTQRRKSLDTGVVLGEGKLEELARLTGGTGKVERRYGKKKAAVAPDDEDEAESEDEAPGSSAEKAEPRANLVVVDHELSPLQVKNLGSATGADVMDRAGVIVEIFHRHAASREARLQVEMARLRYVAPRLRASGGGFDRQGGGIGAKGAGESQLELDRRKIRDRVSEIKKELEQIEAERLVRRQRRSDANRVALVGYTNAGKSSWMRALTASEVKVADQLFATLDTTVRALAPETQPRILISDTVGFIEKLPHDLVASFRSTLDEALEASLLVFVVDASDPEFRRQLGVARRVLGEIGAGEVPSTFGLNKADRLTLDERSALAAEFPGAELVSAKDPADVARMHDGLARSFAESLPVAEWLVPYERSALVGEIWEKTTVLEEEYLDGGIRFRVRGAKGALDRIAAQLS